MLDRIVLEEIYYNLLVEGIEEKIPKLLVLVPPNIENKEDYIREVAQTFDPTKNADYITWILKMLKMRVFRGEEDAGKCRETLELFTKLKTVPTYPKDKRDLNRYRNYDELVDVVEEYSDIKSKKEIVRVSMEEGMTLMGELPPYKLYVVTTPEAGAKHFRNTHWCVKDPHFFNRYGIPYYYFTKNDEPHRLMHLDSGQCKNPNDGESSLDGLEKEMMESEEVTNYVMENDNGDSAMSTYYSKVGGGYDNLIGNMIKKQMDDLVASYELKHLNFYMDDYYEEEGVSMSASGFMPYNFSGIMDMENEKIIKVVKDALFIVDIYPEYLKSDDIQEDGIRFNLEYDERSNYTDNTVMDKLKSFLEELYQMDSSWDDKVESFNENLTEKLKESGMISSAYATFIGRVFPKVEFKNFTKMGGYFDPVTGDSIVNKNIYLSPPIPMKAGLDISIGTWRNKGAYYGQLWKKHSYSELPIVIFSKFISSIMENNIDFGISLKGGSCNVWFRYIIQYDNESTLDDYINDLKIVMSLDKHWEIYTKQMQDFWDKYVLPYYDKKLEDGSYDVPDDLKIPILKAYHRKESGNQMHFDLHEKKAGFDFLLNRLKILNQ